MSAGRGAYIRRAVIDRALERVTKLEEAVRVLADCIQSVPELMTKEAMNNPIAYAAVIAAGIRAKERKRGDT